MTVTIDGRTYEDPCTGTVLDVLRRHGLAVPTLCHDDRLAPSGGCRVCLVHVERVGHLVTACTTAARAGDIITVMGATLTAARRAELALIARHLPTRALEVGDTALRRCLEAYRVELGDPGPTPGTTPDIDTTHPLIHHDPALCIQCDRCVRICDELQAQHVWHVRFRGERRTIVAEGDEGLGASACVSCGACVDSCPTGSLFDAHGVAGASPDRWVRTTCSYCGTGCELDAGVANDQVVGIRPATRGPVSGGHLCVKGRYGFGFTHAGDRIDTPLLRQRDSWVRVSWSEALGFVADRLDAIIAARGPDAVGVLGSARAPNEDNYVLQKFARLVIGTNNVDNCARVCHTPSAAALKMMLGTGAATNSFADIDTARLLMVVGANPTENHPIVGARIKRAVERGTPLVVIDPRRTELARLATVHLRPRPGTDIAVLNAMAHVIVRDGLIDPAFVDERVEDMAAFERFIDAWPPERAASTSGVDAGLIRQAAHLYGSTRPGYMCHGLGATEHVQGTETVMALVNLALLTGNLGRPGAGVNPLRGQNNVQGAAHMGCDPGVLPGGASIKEHRTRFAQLWDRPLPATPGRHQLEMIDAAARGDLRALYVMGYDVLLSNPQAAATEAALGRLELLVVQDLFVTETARRFAHVVLPAASAFERDGTFMNGERRIQPVRACVPPPGEARPDWQIVCALAERLGKPHGFHFDSAEAIWEEIRRVWPDAAGITYARLHAEGGLQWPCPTLEHPGTGVLHVRGFSHGPRASLRRLDLRPQPEQAGDIYPLVMMTGRTLPAFNAHTMTGRSLTRVLHDTDYVEVSPEDAAALGLGQTGSARIVSRFGSAKVRTLVTDRVPPGHVFATFHDPRVMLNATTSGHRDRFTGTPAYKVTAVKLEPAPE